MEFSVYKNPYNNCCQMSLSLSQHTKIDVGWGFAPDPTGGAYRPPPDPLVGFKGPEGNGGEGREGLGAGGEGKGRERGDGEGGKREKLGDGAKVAGGIDAPGRSKVGNNSRTSPIKQFVELIGRGIQLIEII